jgi:hypothetical protein
VLEDATVALPLIVGAVLQRIGYFGKPAAPQKTGKRARKPLAAVSSR